MKKSIIPLTVTILASGIVLIMTACGSSPQKTVAKKDSATILANMTIEEKVGQMLQPAVYNIRI